MTDAIKVTVTIGDRQVTLEGPEDFVRTEVRRFAIGDVKTAQSAVPSRVGDEGADAAETERELVEAKKPSGHSETVAVLAYFGAKHGQAEFTPEDMRRAYARAGRRPPKVMAQALRDAKNAHDYLEAGTGRGKFRLSPHGERTVEFDLPRGT